MNRSVGWRLSVFLAASLLAGNSWAEAQSVTPPVPSLFAAPAPASSMTVAPAAPLASARPPAAESAFQVQATRGDPDAYYVTVTQDGRDVPCSHHVWFGNPCQVLGLHPGPAVVGFGRVGTETRTKVPMDIPPQAGVAVLDNARIPPLWNTGLGLGIAGAVIEATGLLLEFTANSDACLQSKPCLTGIVFNAVGLASVLAGSLVRLAAYQALPELRPIAANETTQSSGAKTASSGPVFEGVGVSVQPKGSSLLLSWNF